MNPFKVIPFFIALLCFGLVSCCTKQKPMSGDDIPFREASHYFVRNDVKSYTSRKIETEEEFFEIFGMAAVMGPDGLPTEIDFNSQYVIAIILPPTNKDAVIQPLRFTKGKTLDFTYRVKRGKSPRSYSFVPYYIAIVDKKYNGDVTITEK